MRGKSSSIWHQKHKWLKKKIYKIGHQKLKTVLQRTASWKWKDSSQNGEISENNLPGKGPTSRIHKELIHSIAKTANNPTENGQKIWTDILQMKKYSTSLVIRETQTSHQILFHIHQNSQDQKFRQCKMSVDW